MTDDGAKVLRGFVRLSSNDRDQVIEEINRFLKVPDYERKNLKERYMQPPGVYIGPVDSGCPCCGR